MEAVGGCAMVWAAVQYHSFHTQRAIPLRTAANANPPKRQLNSSGGRVLEVPYWPAYVCWCPTRGLQ